MFVRRGRVIQVSASMYMVESKKYPPSMNKPSHYHIIQKRPRCEPWDLFCDCSYHGYVPDRFNTCSHNLAVLLELCLKAGDTRLLVMRDVAKKKQQATQAVPTRGNEYPDHSKQKERVYKLLSMDGWMCKYELEVLCKNPHTGLPNKYPYSLDVFACTYINGIYHRIGVEINREKTGGGHGSKITIPKDHNRAQEIEEQHHIKVIAFNVSHLKTADDTTVLREIYDKI